MTTGRAEHNVRTYHVLSGVWPLLQNRFSFQSLAEICVYSHLPAIMGLSCVTDVHVSRSAGRKQRQLHPRTKVFVNNAKNVSLLFLPLHFLSMFSSPMHLASYICPQLVSRNAGFMCHIDFPIKHV